MNSILYEDYNVMITREEVTIFQYYFPIPMDKTIKMKDIHCIGLKTDLNENKKYIQIDIHGLSFNAAFSPDDPNKVLALIQTYSSLARGSLDLGPGIEKKQKIQPQKHKETQSKHNLLREVKEEPKNEELIKKNIRNIQPTQEDARRQNLEYSHPSVLGAMGVTLSHGWQAMKQVANNLYEATAQKMHVFATGGSDQEEEKKQQDQMRKEMEASGKKAFKQQNQKEQIKSQELQGSQGISKKEGTQRIQKISKKQGIKKETPQTSVNEKVSQGWKQVKQSPKSKEQLEKENIATNFDKAKISGGYPSQNISKKLGQLSLEDKQIFQSKQYAEPLKQRGNQAQSFKK